ncbi:MAG: TylF/MycF/NovP-related O-methyltransferase [Pseudomonadota bacterium]
MFYDQDGLRTGHNHDFVSDPAFMAAYARGVEAADGTDYKWHWRVHIGLWAARTAAQAPGDYVECGVNVGFLSSAIMHDLDWNRFGRRFFLLDTFKGIDPDFVTDQELEGDILGKNQKLLDTGFYVTSADRVRQNFAEFRNVEIIEGTVPHTLGQVTTDRIAYLHIDMNCAPPEVAALEHFWPRLSVGAIVLLDDYAFHGYLPQKLAMDELAGKLGFQIASLPTGQGLIVRGGDAPGAAPKPSIWARLLRRFT